MQRLFYSPALLPNQYITLYNFKVYNMMLWYTYVLQYDFYMKVRHTSSTSHYFCVCACVYMLMYVVWTRKIYSLSNVQVHNTVLLTIVAVLYIFRFP